MAAMTQNSRTTRSMIQKLMGRMMNVETLLDPGKSENIIASLLADSAQVGDPNEAQALARQDLAAAWGYADREEGRKPFIYNDGVAVIPIHGVLINRFAYSFGWATGYDFIRAQMNAAIADPDVRLIAYDYDTPGGEAAGCAELAQEFYDNREVKPNVAIVNSLAASGGMWLCAGNSRIIAAPSSSVGSIGVYILHMSMAGMLAEFGLDPTFVQAGKLKTAGNQYQPLDKQALAYLQSMVDERYGEFTAAVAEMRGIDVAVVSGTEARIMRPNEALAIGLIDEVKLPSKAVSDFLAELGNPAEPVSDPEEENTMAEISSEDRAAIAGEVKARIKGIMTHEEAKGRTALAEHLAHETESTVEQAVAILKVSPKVEAEKPAEDKPAGDKPADDKPADDKPADDKPADDKDKDNARGGSNFENAMGNSQHPNAGADGNGGDGDGKGDKVNSILADQAAATGRDYRAKPQRDRRDRDD